MERAVQGESNTLLLLGAPGSSKSVIVETALEKLRREYKDSGGFYTIRLDGEVQMDDKIALRAIARQLALEMNVEMEKVIPLPCILSNIPLSRTMSLAPSHSSFN
jgi:Ni2+-binding GTPase involved in maturation of urease and hydrogenase